MIAEKSAAEIAKTHVVFVDSEDDRQTYDAEKDFNTPIALMGRAYNRPTYDQITNGSLLVNPGKYTADELAEMQQESKESYEALAQALKHKKSLDHLLAKLEKKHNIMTTKHAKDIEVLSFDGRGNPRKIKWKKRRQK
mmetsp:Transcript_11889/g.13086  ORF Transcript_11889/g.13086 Transcript_11889/m.13086 type:complete len:138 (-) Transcript_11889:209-622(-)